MLGVGNKSMGYQKLSPSQNSSSDASERLPPTPVGCTIQCNSNNLLDFAHRKSKFFYDDPKFSNFSWEAPNFSNFFNKTPQFLYYKPKVFLSRPFDKSSPLSGLRVAGPHQGAWPPTCQANTGATVSQILWH